jgi:hypothetical protein
MVRTPRSVWILAALLGPMSAQAVIINGTWDFSTESGGTTYSGTFSLTGFDTSLLSGDLGSRDLADI